ncbi:MAG: protease complex subunit PrcB family protein [Candidatus Lokiarchaeota archaeon]|nr:protease complex subunit PrcB family protein [Candidatus Lokiarchaeota archaeon]
MMKSLYYNYILVSLITSFSILVAFLPFTKANLNFETIELGYFGAHRERCDYIIQTQQEWEELWQKVHSSSSEPPYVNFNSHLVIAVFMGERVTGGYRIEITSTRESGLFRWVYIRETSPSPFDCVTMALTQPYHIVKINRNFQFILLIHI